MTECSFAVREDDAVCAVTLTDVQGELADELREHVLAEYEEA